MYRGRDGCLHKPGDPAGTHRTRADGRLHDFSDPINTFRNETTYALHGTGGKFAGNHLKDESVVYKSNASEPQPYTVKDQEIRDAIDSRAADRDALKAERDPANAIVKQHMAEFGIQEIHDLAAKKIEEAERRIVREINSDPQLGTQDRIAKLDRLREMLDAARTYNRLGPELVTASKDMADLGGKAVAIDPVDRPGAILLSPFAGAIDGSHTFDTVSFLPATESRLPTVVAIENKGVGSTLEDASTKDGPAQQGSPEYYARTIEIDRNLVKVLNETPDQMRARGLDPASPEGQRHIAAREELSKAFHDRTLQHEYYLVHADAQGRIKVSQFSMDRNGRPLEIERFAGVERKPVPERDLIDERMKLLQHAADQQRERALERLTPLERAVVQQVVEGNRDIRVHDHNSIINARQILDRVESMLERADTLDRVSRELSAAEALLNAAQQRDLESHIGDLRDAGLDRAEQAAVERLLALDIQDRNRSVRAEIEVKQQRLIADAADRAIQFRESINRERERFIQNQMNRARQIENNAANRERAPDLQNLIRDHDRLQKVIDAERAAEQNAVKSLGLDPAHARLVTQSLEDKRTRTLEAARQTFNREIMRQATERARAALEQSRDERQRLLGQAGDFARAIEQGRTLGPAHVQEWRRFMEGRIAHERTIEGQTLDALKLNQEQRNHVVQKREEERLREHGRTLDILTREDTRLQHNRLVGDSRILGITREQSRTLDIRKYELCRTLEPISLDDKRGVFIFQSPGEGRVEVGYDSPEMRYGDAVKKIEKERLPVDAVEARFLARNSNAKPPREAVRTRPEVPPKVTRARAIEEERERQRQRARQGRDPRG